LTFGIIFASEKLAEASELDDHPRAVFLADLVRWDRHLLLALDELGRVLQLFGKFSIELSQRILPLKLSVFDLVELLFHLRRIAFVEDVVECLDKEIVNRNAKRRRMESSFDLLDVL